MKLKLRTKILMLPVAFVLVILTICILIIVSVQGKVISTVHEKLKSDLAMGEVLLNEKHPGEWSIRDNKLFKGETQINDNFVMVDQIGALTGDTVTLFQRDTRVATNVRNASGGRAVGTRAAENVIEATLKKGETYIGKAMVVGVWNQTAYKPIKNNRGEILGMFYVGVPHTHYAGIVKDLALKVILFSIVGLLIVLSLCMYLYHSITRPVHRVAEELSWGADQVSSASVQIAQVSQQVAQGAGSQASGIEETSSSLEEIASMTRQNVSSSEEANRLMSEAGDNITKGRESMKRLRGAIEEIKRSSDETSKIVKTIDGIAFQTNLLALNAAVEAARAGDAGKGFAVVAEEVRNLAQRAGEAARNTASLLEGSMKNADQGVSGWRDTATALGDMVAIVQKAGERISEITAASKEQAQGIEQVVAAVANINQVTQANAANAEESASSSEALNVQASQVKGMIQELRALVGSSNGTGVGSDRGFEKAAQEIKALPNKTTHLSRNTPSPLQPSIQRTGKKMPGKKRVAPDVPIDPEEVIPFHEGKEKDEEVLRHF